MYLTKYNANEIVSCASLNGTVEVLLHIFITSVLDGGQWSASCPSHFTPGEGASNTHLIGSWIGPRASVYMVVKRKITAPYSESNPGCPAHSSVTILTDLPWFLILFN
jgi:hypothetical protein